MADAGILWVEWVENVYHRGYSVTFRYDAPDEYREYIMIGLLKK